jgi:hypothetical protein
MPRLFDATTLAAMRDARRVFDPDERANPGKVIPVHACREWSMRGETGKGKRETSAESPAFPVSRFPFPGTPAEGEEAAR